VLAVLVAGALAAIVLVSLAAWPVLPVLGVTVAAVAMVVNSMTTRLGSPTCWGCGQRLAPTTPGEHGVACPSCGAVNQTLPQPPAHRRP